MTVESYKNGRKVKHIIDKGWVYLDGTPVDGPKPCSHCGNNEELIVVLPKGKCFTVDKCIAPIVQALNNAGAFTVASCCGHGRIPGNIALEDGREIVICPDYETARKVYSAFGGIND